MLCAAAVLSRVLSEAVLSRVLSEAHGGARPPSCACLLIRSLTGAWLQFKNWSLDFASVPQHLKADTNLEEQEGLIRQAQRLCSQLVGLIHTDVLSVKSFNTDSRSATKSTVGIMLTCVRA